MNHHNLQYALEEAPFEPEGKAIAPAGVNGKIEAWGATVPTAGSADYAPGCIFHHTDGGAGTGIYVNEGTATSCSFVAVTTPGNIATQVDTAFPVSGSASGRGPSPLIWDTCPVLDYFLDPTKGHAYFNDFQGDYVMAQNTTATHMDNGVSGFTAANGGTISVLTTDPNGAIALLATADNESTGISVLGGKNSAGFFVFTSGKKSWFEARLKFNVVDNTKFGVFVGFAEEALLAENGTLVDAGTMADKDYFGYMRLEADGDRFDIVHNTAGGGGMSTVLADAITLAKDTYVKVGFYCDGTTVYTYADGDLVASSSVALAATNFPDGEEMAFYAVVNCCHADDAIMTLDWVRIGREF